MNKNKLWTEKGFTITELLVAMAILGLLIGLLIPGVGIVRRGARNTARRTSLQAIQAEIEEYYGTHRTYPSAISSTVKTEVDVTDLVDSQFEVSDYSTGLTSVDSTSFIFSYKKVGNEYELTVYLEPNAEAYSLSSTTSSSEVDTD